MDSAAVCTRTSVMLQAPGSDDDESQSRIFDKFDKVFTLFCDPQLAIEDDTIPDRLLSCIGDIMIVHSRRNVTSLQQFLNLEGVQSLLTNAPLSHQNKKIAAFALKVLGILGSIEGGFQLIEQNGSFKKVFTGCSDSVMFLDATVREAWFTSLELVLINEATLECVLEIGAVDKLMNCLTDSSLFVSKSALKLLKKILSLLSLSENKGEGQGQPKILPLQDELVQRLIVGLAKGVQERDMNVSTTFLNVLYDMCSVEGIARCLVENEQHLTLLSRCLEESDLIKPAAGLITKIVEKTGEPLPNSVLTSLTKSPQHLIELHRIDDAFRIAAQLVTAYQSRDNSICEDQLHLLRMPVNLLCSMGTIQFGDSLQGFFEGKSNFRRATLSMLCRAMDIMKSNSEIEPILNLDELCNILEVSVAGSTPVSTKWTHFLHESPQIQKAALDILQMVAANFREQSISLNTQVDGSLKESIKKTVKILMRILDSPDTDTGVLMKCLDAQLAFLKSVPVLNSVFPNLGCLIKKLMCDVRWEIRDSALTFLAGICASSAALGLSDWILEHNLQRFVTDSLQDSDSYVRATALACAQKMVCCERIWKAEEMENLISTAMNIIATDSEGFPRRAAITLIGHLNKAGLIPERTRQRVYSCMACAGRDFDWEVKLHAVEFWEDIIEQDFRCEVVNTRNRCDIPCYAQSLYQKAKPSESECCSENGPSTCMERAKRLVLNHCLESLLISVSDYDQSVKSKACQILLDLRTRCESDDMSLEFIEAELEEVGLTRAAAVINLDSLISLSDSDAEVDKGSDRINGNGDLGSNREDSSPEFTKLEHSVDYSRTLKFLCTLFTLDLDTLIKQSRQTTDEYVLNPESLLDDIIAWSTETEEILVDCY